MKELLVATSNLGKMREFKSLLSGLPLKLYSLKDFPEIVLPPEDGDTFAENALIKARAGLIATGLPTVADDSGLCVDFLGGAPGVHSARYAGSPASDEANNEKLLEDLRSVPIDLRKAAFRCVIALCKPDLSYELFPGELQGIILENTIGSGGFGYDPLFLIPEYGKTLAELSLETKNCISHRGKASDLLKEYMKLDRKLFETIDDNDLI